MRITWNPDWIIKNKCPINVALIQHYYYIYISECRQHCSLCYNQTECYECTQGYFLNAEMECESKKTYIVSYIIL